MLQEALISGAPEEEQAEIDAILQNISLELERSED